MADSWLQMIAPRPRSRSSTEGDHRYTGEMAARGDYLSPRRVIYDHELILYEVGDFVVEFDDGLQVPCPAGSFIVIPPGRMHSERATAGRPGLRRWCHFDWTYAPRYDGTPVQTFAPGEPRAGMYRPAPPCVPAGVLHGAMAAPASACGKAQRIAALLDRQTEAALLEARAVLLGLLIELFADAPAVGPGGGAAPGLPSRIRQLLDRAVQLDAATAPLTTMLAELGYSYEHLCRVFSRTYGVSPQQYLQAVRIARSQVLLRDGTLTVAEVGYRTGFNSPAYFAKMFRHYTGQTPRQYRQTQQGV